MLLSNISLGFQEAKILGRKFITLYTLCKELLSKQDHYDWGLRAIKSVLVVAGSLKVGLASVNFVDIYFTLNCQPRESNMFPNFYLNFKLINF